MLNENEIILPKKIGMKINFSPPKNMAQDLLNLLLSNIYMSIITNKSL